MSRGFAIRVSLALLAVIAPTSAVADCPGDRLVLDCYPFVEDGAATALSPDGGLIAAERAYLDAAAGYAWTHEIRIADKRGRVVERLGAASMLSWSPDGQRLLYVRPNANGQRELVVADRLGQGARAVLTLDTEPMSPTWSPDSTRIVYALRRAAPPPPLYELPAAIEAQTRSPRPFETTALHHQMDGEGLLPQGRHEVHLLDLAMGASRLVVSLEGRLGWSDSALPLDAPTFAWAADGKALYVDGNLEANADLAGNENYIYRLDLDTGRTERVVGGVAGHARGFFSEPRLSPDGRFLAFKGVAWTEPFLALPSEVWVLELATGNIRQLTRLDASAPDALIWSAASDALLFTMFDRGNTVLYRTGLDGQTKRLARYPDGVTVEALALAREGTLACTRSGFSQPPQACVIHLSQPGRLRVVAPVGHRRLAAADYGDFERLSFRSADGTAITAWLLRPIGFDPAKRYPLILRPDQGVGFQHEIATYRAEGYAVLLVHPRSTQNGTGFGRAFLNHMRGQPLNDELRADLLGAVDAALTRPFLDKNRAFVAGSSLGGGLAAWLITQTDRFRAAVVYRPTHINLVSDVLARDEVTLSLETMPRPPWDDPAGWMRHSIITQAPKIVTPTLIVTGEDDRRTLITESVQLYSAIKLLGKASARLIRMPGVHHGWGSDAGTFMRLTGYTLAWLRQWDGVDMSRAPKL